MNIEDYRKIQEYKRLKVPIAKIVEEMNISEYYIKKYMKMTEEEFVNFNNDNKNIIDSYKDFIMDIIKVTPTIPDTNIYYKILETFPEFNVSESSFRKYVKRLRVETGYDKYKNAGKTLRDDPIPGDEAQIDFGQYKIKDIYGKNRLLYFFVMVLRYSQLKYVFFSTTDFNALKAIEAHKLAFKFFGGTPNILLYDQDKVFAVSENFGNVILVKEFESFLKEYGLSFAFCSGYHPQGKGTVENYVKIVKDNFLKGRTYAGIDSLNSACLEWLDNTENNHIIARRQKTPHELFKDEFNLLRKVKPTLFSSDKALYKVMDNYIVFRYSKYEVPPGYTGMYVKVESDGIIVVIKDMDTDEIIATHNHATAKDSRMSLTDRNTEGNAEYVIRHYFCEDKIFLEYIDKLKKEHDRYFKKSCVKIRHLMKSYTKEELVDAFRFCINNNDSSITCICSYLIYKYKGKDNKKIFGNNYYYYFNKSKELEKTLNGK